MTMIILASQAWNDLIARLDGLFSGATEGFLAFTLALLVGLVGWAVAALLATAARLLLRALRFNEGVRGLAGGGTPGQEPAALAAWAIYWSLIAVALILALDTMGLRLGEAVTLRLGEVLPRIVASAFLLAIGVLVAMLLGALTRRFFDTAGLHGEPGDHRAHRVRRAGGLGPTRARGPVRHGHRPDRAGRGRAGVGTRLRPGLPRAGP